MQQVCSLEPDETDQIEVNEEMQQVCSLEPDQ